MIEADQLTKRFENGDVWALRGVSLTVAPGEFVAVIGRSGSGKSTLLNLLAGLDEPTGGRVLVDGEAACTRRLERLRRTRIALVFQSFLLLPNLSARENVQVPMLETERRRSVRVRRADELLDAVGLSDRADHRPHQLSMGQRQRVAIARALANGPDVILADEPTGNLDEATSERLIELFGSLRDEGRSLLMVTHSREVASRADRRVELRDGLLYRAYGKPSRIAVRSHPTVYKPADLPSRERLQA